MTEPQPPAEGSSLSPRHRPDVKTLVKNSTEQDLWDLDELPTEDTTTPAASAAPLPPKNSARATAPLPVAVNPVQPDAAETAPILEVPLLPRHKSIHTPRLERRGYGTTPPPTAAPAEPASPQAPFKKVDMLEDAFHHLDDWHLADELPAPARPPDVLPMAPPEPEPAVILDPKPAPPDDGATPTHTTTPTPDTDRDEFSPKRKSDATPLPLRPKLGLSKMEALGLAALALVLLLGGFWVYQNSLSRLRTQATQTRKITFPVQGSLLTVTKVVTYWRAPINKKGQVETVRRGVVLIPVTELSLRGGPAAIRMLIHNDSGMAVGDPITRQVNGETTLTLAGTDGFEDISMHAVYLTAQSKPWTLHLFEAPSANASREEFKKLLEIPISTEKH